jgi:NAD(P)-dependent dehydrogenase (short-subunit alcohol dehydrogenase family)
VKRALITGGNKGIGFEIARELGKSGYEILLGARNETLGNSAVEELKKEGITASFIKIDLNNFATLHQATNSAGKIDVLVNNAGIPGNLKTEKSNLDMAKSSLAYTTEELRETMEVNFFGTHELIKSLLPNLTSEAKIVNITVPISSPHWHPLAYTTSKAALNVMTMVFGMEFSKTSKHQIFGVMPGAVATDLNGMGKVIHLLEKVKKGEEIEGSDIKLPKEMAHLVKTGLVKTPNEAAKLIAGFVLDGKNYNGKILNWNGSEINSYEPDIH